MHKNLHNKTNKTNKYIIPIQLSNYEEAFNQFDYRRNYDRKLNEDLDDFLKSTFITLPLSKNLEIEIKIFLPQDIKNESCEEIVRRGILSNYVSYEIYEKNIKIMGIRRISYYILISAILFFLWYIFESHNNSFFISEALNTGATVLLWQAMTLIFIENKNFKLNSRINKKLSTAIITFSYLN